jgi:hypothetical protein
VLLQWTVSHPPHDHVIIVFDAGHARDRAGAENSSDSRRNAMKPLTLGLAVAAMLAAPLTAAPAFAQGGKSGVERLYILNCGEGVAGDISRWSPGVNVGKSMDFADSCYLIKHAQGWLLWDTGVADAIAAMPEGQRPADPRMMLWTAPTLRHQSAIGWLRRNEPLEGCRP